MSDIKKFTRAEVSQYNGKNGAPTWLIYKDVIYDVTTYHNEHPNGKQDILSHAGTDCTKAFDSAGHSSDARVILNKFKIGEVVEEEKYYDANGKKKKRVVSAKAEDDGGRSCLNKCTCGLLG